MYLSLAILINRAAGHSWMESGQCSALGKTLHILDKGLFSSVVILVKGQEAQIILWLKWFQLFLTAYLFLQPF